MIQEALRSQAISVVELRATAETLSTLRDNVVTFIQNQYSQRPTPAWDSLEVVQDLIDLVGAVDLGTHTPEFTRALHLLIREYIALDESGQPVQLHYNPNNRFVVLDRRNRAGSGYAGLNAEVEGVFREMGLMDFPELFDGRGEIGSLYAQ